MSGVVIVGFVLAGWVVWVNFIREQARDADMPSEAPGTRSNGPAGDGCHVMWCGKPGPRERRGWKLCDEHYEEKVSGR